VAFVTEKTLFIHVQKTGGMSVREMLYRCIPVGHESGDAEGERHFGLPELRARHPGIESGRLSFGFVRHPVDWLVSRWAFAVASGFPIHVQHRGTAAQVWMACCWSRYFDIFIEKYLERYPGVATQTMFQKLGMWSDKQVDCVGKTENLEADLNRILDAAGERRTAAEPSSPVRRNATERDAVALAVVTPSMRKRIMDAEPKLCDMFDYQ
jgi:hypothetical protein